MYNSKSEIDARLIEIRTKVSAMPEKRSSLAELEQDHKALDAYEAEIKQLIEERATFTNDEAERRAKAEERRQLLRRIADGELGETIERSPEQRSKQMENIDNKELEIRSMQRYLTVGMANMTEQEQRTLVTSGAAAVMPTEIFSKLITGEKYSDLIRRATNIQEPNVGTLRIPIASRIGASVKIEGSDVDLGSTPYAASPALTYLSLNGFEIIRSMAASAATMARSTGEFQNMLLDLLAAEVLEKVEDLAINGVGTTEPLGFENLTSWVTGTNQALTASAVTDIAPADIALGLSYLPQKYYRNAIILMNPDMLYNASQFADANGNYAFNLADATTRFMGKEIVVSELVPDDTVYILDPAQLYIRWAMPIQVQADRSAGFMAATVAMRALAVVDLAVNPAAIVRVGLGS